MTTTKKQSNNETEIPEGWIVTTLGEIAKVQTGPFGSQLKNDQYITGGVPVVTVEHIQNFTIKDFDYPSVTEQDRDRLSKYLLQEGDIVFTRVGSVDLSAYVNKNQDGWMFSSRMLSVRVEAEVNSRFLSYFFQQKKFREYILKVAVGATMPSINTGILKSIPVSYPSLKEQKGIVDVLSSFDNKIELLREQNQTLEKTAQTIFNEWFGKYDIDDELPEGWRVGKVCEITDIKGGATPSTANQDFWGGDINWTSPKDLSNSKSVFLINTAKKITKKGLSSISSGLLPKGTLLLSSRAPIGYLAISNIDVAINQGYIALLEGAYVSNHYMYLWLKRNMENVINAANGSTFLEISKSSFKTIDCVIPDLNTLKNFDHIIMPFFNKILVNIEEIETLEKMRNRILPKLMNGEIRVN